MDQPNPARLYALTVGALLALAGVLGFFYEWRFATGDRVVADELAGIVSVNGWHNLLHLLTGIAGLALATIAARAYAAVVGGAYLLLALWGLVASENEVAVLADAIPVDTQGNLIHLLIGGAGIAAAAASGPRSGIPRARSPRREGRSAPAARPR